jgi:hypothetical protein
MCARVCSVQVPTFPHLAEKSAKLVFGRQAFHCFVWLEAIFAWLMLGMPIQLYYYFVSEIQI